MYANLIDPVTAILRDILKIAIQFERSQNEREQVRAVLRKLLVIREMHATYFICVTGTQGAGKTHLLRELYGLDGWLDDNAGRGERRPLFILESDYPAPRAFGVDEHGQEVEIDQETLTQELRSFSNGERFLLLRLYVPRRYFSQGFGFLLLPGYERLNRTNALWQEEMRETLKHAMGSILVTHQTALADNATKEIIADLLQQEMQGRQPTIAIGRTESKSEDERQELRQTAAEVCQVPQDEYDRIICVGRGDDYRAEWLTQMMNALGNYALVPDVIHHRRLSDLRHIIDVELEAAVMLLEALVEDAGARASGQDLLLEGILNKFRLSAENYRKKYQQSLRTHIGAYASSANEAAKEAYGRQEEGLGNKLRNAADFFMLNAGETDQRFIDRINQHWLEHKDQTPLDATYAALSHMARDQLKLAFKADQSLSGDEMLRLRDEGETGKYLGYEQQDGTSIEPFGGRLDLDNLQKHLCLLLKDADTPVTLDTASTRKAEINEALKYLPALTMEYLRFSQGVVLAHHKSVDSVGMAQYDAEQLAKDIGSTLPKLTSGVQQAVKALLAVSAVDLAIDGSFDVIPALTGGTVTGLGATLSLWVTGIMGLGFVGYKVAQSVHAYDVSKKNFIAASIQNYADHLVESNLQRYDEMMEVLEERMERNLSLAYGIDKDQFAERDALARALRTLNLSRRHLEEEIDRVQARYLA